MQLVYLKASCKQTYLVSENAGDVDCVYFHWSTSALTVHHWV